MKRSHFAAVAALLTLTMLFTLLTAGCTSGDDKANESVTPTQKVTNTTPTDEPKESPTPTPTEEPQPSPTPTPDPSLRAEVPYGKWNSLNKLYEKAYDIGEKYGVRIYVADLVPQEILEYVSGVDYVNAANITATLDELDYLLGLFPENFFVKFLDEFIDFHDLPFEIYVAGEADHVNAVTYLDYVEGDDEDWHYTHYGVYIDTPPAEQAYMLSFYLASSIASATNIARTWNEEEDPGTVAMSFETWMSLNPSDFVYLDDNVTVAAATALQEKYWEYFLIPSQTMNIYSDQFALFGYLFMDTAANDITDVSPQYLKKVGYYLECLRKDLDSSNWPAETSWEATYHKMCKKAGVEPGWQ